MQAWQGVQPVAPMASVANPIAAGLSDALASINLSQYESQLRELGVAGETQRSPLF